MYENGALREVMEAIYTACGGAVPKKTAERPSLVVYMNYEFWQECMAQNGRLSRDAFTFVASHGTGQQRLMGFPVYKVASLEHPKYRIYVDD